MASLSPAESLGLAGAALEARIRDAASHVPDANFAQIAARLSADASHHDMIYDHEGRAETIRIMLRPLLAMPEQLTYVHHVCLALVNALERLPQLYLDDPRVREVIAVTEGEERWLREMWTEAHRHFNPIYGRLDAVCDFAAQAWQDGLKFMEPNLSGVGGINYGPVAEELVMRDCVPELVAHDPGLEIERPADQRDLFVQLMLDHARAVGRPGANLCFIEPKYDADGPDEQSALSRHLAEKYGLKIAHADPRELELKGGEVYYRDLAIDVAYRDYETRELIELEHELGRPLDAIRTLFRENRVVSSLAGDFDHKSCWEILTDESLAERNFSADERRLFRRHVLWTRVVGDRRTTLPHGREGDLLEYARTHREELVLKPNRAYGGSGVAIGAAVSQPEWDRLLNEAVSKYRDPLSSWVIQSATRLPVSDFPVLSNGRVRNEPFYVVMGFAPTENGLAVMCRVSQKQVVNVAQHGGMAAVLLAHPPDGLAIPRRSRANRDAAPAALRSSIAELIHLDRAIAALEWDEEVQIPPEGRDERGDQLATLSGLRHRLLVSDQLGDLIEDVESSEIKEWDRELELLRRQRREALALPESLVRRFAAARAHATGAWEEARRDGGFRSFAPALADLVELVRVRAEALAQGAAPYDALLEEYEPGMTVSRLEPMFAILKDRLVPMVARLAESGFEPVLPELDEHSRVVLCRALLDDIGFDFRRGRLDFSTHPFTAQLGRADVRLTMRRREGLVHSVLTVLHEGGHALYDQGFLESDAGSLLADAPSMGMHEGQARLWENHVGRGRAFWQYFASKARAVTGEVDGDACYRAANRVGRGTIRVSADEISYHLHIIMRFELEQALVTGSLSVGDLETAFNDLSRELLGAVPQSSLDGVMQDSHWAGGMFGYFPSYTIGSLYAAQLAQAYERGHDLDGEVAHGDFSGLRRWLGENVYASGNRFTAGETIRRATGSDLDVSAFLEHLERKFGSPR